MKLIRARIDEISGYHSLPRQPERGESPVQGLLHLGIYLRALLCIRISNDLGDQGPYPRAGGQDDGGSRLASTIGSLESPFDFRPRHGIGRFWQDGGSSTWAAYREGQSGNCCSCLLFKRHRQCPRPDCVMDEDKHEEKHISLATGSCRRLTECFRMFIYGILDACFHPPLDIARESLQWSASQLAILIVLES